MSPFDAVVQIEAVYAARYAPLACVQRLDRQVEQVSRKPSMVRHGIEAAVLYALNAFCVLRVLQLLLDALLDSTL